MKALRSNVDMWTQIQNTGKGGYGGRLTEKLDDYIDQAGKLEELTDQLYEGCLLYTSAARRPRLPLPKTRKDKMVWQN